MNLMKLTLIMTLIQVSFKKHKSLMIFDPKLLYKGCFSGKEKKMP